MTRYLVLEVVDDMHDLTDLVEDMRLGEVQQLYAGGYVLNVKIPARPLIVPWFKDNDPRNPRQFYVGEA